MESKTDLRSRNFLSDISQIYYLLNGYTSDGQNATYGSLFKKTRYAIILLAAITLHNFKDQTLKIRGIPFYNLYRLEKVADLLHLEYDRTKQAKKIYENLENDGDVKKVVTEDNKTYISLTEKGINVCLRKIRELHQLKDYFARLPPLEQKYTMDRLTGRSVAELQSKSYAMTQHENNVEKLIKSISD